MTDTPSGLVPLPATMTENRLRSASPEQRAAWLAEADATAPARAARMRETLARIDAPKAAAPAAAPLPVGEQREAATRAYAAWKDARIAEGLRECEHGASLLGTCLPCFDGRAWEAKPASQAAFEAACEAATVELLSDPADPWMAALDPCKDEATLPAAPTPEEPDRLAALAARVRALEQRPPVVAPPAIPAELREQIARAEGVADTARKAVEALAARVAALAAPAQTVTAGPTAVAVAAPEPLRLRSSALPLFAACAASMDLSPEQIRIETTGEPARLGTAVHAAAAIMVRRGTDAARDACDEIAERHQVDRDDLGRLVWLAGEAWREIGARFPAPVVESSIREARDGLVLTGHPDIYSLDGRTLRVLDWKSGRVTYDTREQLLGYTLLVLSILTDEEAGRLGEIEVYTAWLRDGRIVRIRFSLDEVIAWGCALDRRARIRPLPYSPGPHCVTCPRCADCPAKVAWVRQAVAEMGGGTPAEALAKARAVGKAADQAIEAIRGQAIAAGVEGLEVAESQRVTVRLAHAAVPEAVRRALGADMTVGGTEMRKALRHELGLDGAGVEEEMARLVEAGAAQVVVSRRVKETKA